MLAGVVSSGRLSLFRAAKNSFEIHLESVYSRNSASSRPGLDVETLLGRTRCSKLTHLALAHLF